MTHMQAFHALGAREVGVWAIAACIALTGLACGGDDAAPSTAVVPGDDAATDSSAAAAAPEAATDAAKPDAASEPVSLTAYDDGAPQAGLSVVFHAADGAVLAVETTGADGKATSTAAGVAMVTVLRADQSLITIFDVEPKDALFVGSAQVLGKSAGTINVTAPTPVTNSTDYAVDVATSSKIVTDITVGAQMDLKAANLLTGEGASVLAWSRDKDQVPYSYAYATGIQPGDAGVTPAILGAWSADWISLIVRLKQAPMSAATVAASIAPVSAGLAYYDLNPWQVSAPAMQVNMFQFGVPALFGDLLEYTVAASYGVQGDGTDSVLVKRIKERPTEVDVDMKSELLPGVQGVAADTATPARPKMTWGQDAALSAADGVLVEAQWAQSGASRRWVGLAAANHPEGLTFPKLPDALAQSGPDASSTFGRFIVTFVEADFLEDYRALRLDYGPAVLETPLPKGPLAVRFTTGAKKP
ncbi:MAG: hypothetical protein HY898_19745 [Deltaproteobacteria bacterium]|nr:hypothetical protein [Deltaproteobacteria bacterium]